MNPKEQETVGALLGRATALTAHLLSERKIAYKIQRDFKRLEIFMPKALQRAKGQPELAMYAEELSQVAAELEKYPEWQKFQSTTPAGGAMWIAYYKKLAEIDRDEERLKIGRIITAERQRQNMSLNDLAKKAEMPVNNIIRIEGGRYNYTIDNLFKVAAALGLRFDCLSTSWASAHVD